MVNKQFVIEKRAQHLVVRFDATASTYYMASHYEQLSHLIAARMCACMCQKQTHAYTWACNRASVGYLIVAFEVECESFKVVRLHPEIQLSHSMHYVKEHVTLFAGKIKSTLVICKCIHLSPLFQCG